MSERLRLPGRPALFLAVRFGVPGVLALLGLAGAAAMHGVSGWWLLLSVASLAEASQIFQQGSSYLRHRNTLVRRDSLWVRAVRPLMRLLGCEEAWVRSFLAWNNERVEAAFSRAKAQQALVLLPHCIQLASCKAGVTEDIGNCYQCGQCPVGEALESSLVNRWDARIFNRSHKAARCAKECKPDLMVAVSCADRLLKGILKLPETPCFGIPLDLPYGMCVDTRFDTAEVEQAMERLVRPRPERSGNIQPFHADEIA
ncbi:MAG: hypothetical protein H6Q00_296 [Holophagaceae bacterium]|nr:hypothetical protein [Holophagaceae bacterium]